jgi:hypothetical protein
MTTVNSFSDRLKSKSVKNSIINNIARDFNLTPILAEAYFNQIKDYFTEHVQLNLTSGQVHYLAVDDREPAGKPVQLCLKKSVRLTLHNPDEDLSVYKKEGLAALRQHRLIRITKEAIEQGTLLSQLDLAVLLSVNEYTAGCYVREYQSLYGRSLTTRGNIQQIGSGQTHKKEIVSFYQKGYLVSTTCLRQAGLSKS